MSENDQPETESATSSTADDAAYARNLSHEIEEQAAKAEAAIEDDEGISLEEAVQQADDESAS